MWRSYEKEASRGGIEDAAFEKHIPVYTMEGDTAVHVFVGEVEHPMTAEHWIEWVLKTDKGIQKKISKTRRKNQVLILKS